jgi:hypothetical protein
MESNVQLDQDYENHYFIHTKYIDSLLNFSSRAADTIDDYVDALFYSLDLVSDSQMAFTDKLEDNGEDIYFRLTIIMSDSIRAVIDVDKLSLDDYLDHINFMKQNGNS